MSVIQTVFEAATTASQVLDLFKTNLGKLWSFIAPDERNYSIALHFDLHYL